MYVVCVVDRNPVFTPHAQRERGKVIGRGVHIYNNVYVIALAGVIFGIYFTSCRYSGG